MRLLAVDLGGSHAECALVDDRTILARERVAVRDGVSLDSILPEIESALRRLLAHGSVDGIGFGFCGLVDAPNTRVSSTNGKFVDAVDVDLSAWARDRLQLPLRLENDARLALLGECSAGAAQGETDAVLFTLGTGIGGVAMMNGRPLQGKHGQAGVLGGHVPVRINGRRCTCGGLGCAESEASGWALPIVCSEWPGFAASKLAACEINFKSLFACAAAGDSVATEIQHHCLNVWGAAAVAAIHAFDPDVLLYGGGVMKNADVVIPSIQDYVKCYAWTPWGKVRIRAAQLGNDAALLGVVPLFQQENGFVR
ncbi:MAG TPA: ROK family protein [Acidobacteriaceae bacterium]|jgi:glucokinase|nr:ROK family protein [Acidobacteriaceae bacterium]